MRSPTVILLAALLAAPASAEVLSASASHFELQGKATVSATPTEVYEALAVPGRWWDPDHTYSGDAANLSLEPRAGGCFCETIPADGGTIEHARVIYARPGASLRLEGGLGPLQAQAVVGTWTWTFKAVSGGTEIIQNYLVAGHMRGQSETLAPLVDQVMQTQLTRLARHVADRRGRR